MSVVGAPLAAPARQAASPERARAAVVDRVHVLSPFAIWLGLIAYVAVAKLMLDAFLPDAFALPGQAFSWQALIISAAAGVAGIGFARATGFSPARAPRVSAGRQLVVPALLGFGLAGVMVVFDLATGASRAINAFVGMSQQFTDHLSMLLIFSAAAIHVEPMYRLLLIHRCG